MICNVAYTFLILYTIRIIACAGSVPAGCWTDNVIPFKISHGFNDSQVYMIQEVIAEFHRFTCIRWADGDKVPYNATDRVVFQKVQQQYICRTQTSLLSNGGEVMVIQLGDSCFHKPVLMHEMMHVLGFSHEHQRADRDCYVFIDHKKADVPISADEVEIKHERWLERFPYDKHSNMHYPRSVLIKVKIQGSGPRRAPTYSQDPLGNVKGDLSFLDLWKILYKFCGFAHYCDVFPEMCAFMDEVEKSCVKRLPT